MSTFRSCSVTDCCICGLRLIAVPVLATPLPMLTREPNHLLIAANLHRGTTVSARILSRTDQSRGESTPTRQRCGHAFFGVLKACLAGCEIPLVPVNDLPQHLLVLLRPGEPLVWQAALVRDAVIAERGHIPVAVLDLVPKSAAAAGDPYEAVRYASLIAGLSGALGGGSVHIFPLVVALDCFVGGSMAPFCRASEADAPDHLVVTSSAGLRRV